MVTEKTAPRWVKVIGGAAFLTTLAAVSSYNILPSLKEHQWGTAAVQIVLTGLLAIIPFIPGWSAKARFWLALVFMIGNGYFAYEVAKHRHDDERATIRLRNAKIDERTAKKEELKTLGKIEAADDSQVAIAQANADGADKDKTAAWASVDTARAQLAACGKYCRLTSKQVERLEETARGKDTAADSAHAELKRLSSLRTLTKRADCIEARIDEINKEIPENEKRVEDASADPSWSDKAEAVFTALLIELANCIAPGAFFKVIILAFSGLLLSSAPNAGAEPVQAQSGPRGPRTKKAPSPRKVSTGGPKLVQSGNVINMDQSRAVQNQRSMVMLERSKMVHDPRFSGLGQREIADQLGWSKTMVQRALSYKPGPIHDVA